MNDDTTSACDANVASAPMSEREQDEETAHRARRAAARACASMVMCVCDPDSPHYNSPARFAARNDRLELPMASWDDGDRDLGLLPLVGAVDGTLCELPPGTLAVRALLLAREWAQTVERVGYRGCWASQVDAMRQRAEEALVVVAACEGELRGQSLRQLGRSRERVAHMLRTADGDDARDLRERIEAIDAEVAQRRQAT